MSRQQGNKHSQAGNGKVNVEQPGQQLEGVRRPAPAVGARAERHVHTVRAVLAHWCCSIWIPTAHVHPVYLEVLVQFIHF